jgi:uncharacterized sulfatase
VAFDGEDLSAALVGRMSPARTRPLYWVRPPDRPGPAGADLPDLAIRDGDWKLLIEADGARAELYDLAVDPTESTNRADERPEIVERLKSHLQVWFADVADPSMFDPAPPERGRRKRAAARGEVPRSGPRP